MTHELFDVLPHEILESLGEMDFAVEHERASSALAALLNQTVLTGGKRLRPMLTLLVGRLIQCPLSNDLLLAAKSIEQVHAASLAHDDVIDLASTRRGRPSINVQSSNKKAVLAGDYLLAQVIVNLAKTNRPELISEMATVIQDLAYGEWIQWDVLIDRQITRELLTEIAAKKTASVMSWCTLAPLLIKPSSQKAQQIARRFGYELGLAFQLMDDTLDDSSDSQKDQNLDVQNEQINAVVYEWMEEDSERFKRYHQGESLESLLRDADLGPAREKVKSRAMLHIERCRAELKNLCEAVESFDQQAQKALDVLIDFLQERRF